MADLDGEDALMRGAAFQHVRRLPTRRQSPALGITRKPFARCKSLIDISAHSTAARCF